jgi:hypothetical protein
VTRSECMLLRREWRASKLLVGIFGIGCRSRLPLDGLPWSKSEWWWKNECGWCEDGKMEEQKREVTWDRFLLRGCAEVIFEAELRKSRLPHRLPA